MLESLDSLQKEAMESLDRVAGLEELPVWYREWLGRKGRVTDLSRGLGGLSPEERPQAGQRINQIKQGLEQAFEAHQQAIENRALEASLGSEALDITLPGRPLAPGHLHLTTQTLRRLRQIFAEMGFQVFETPEVETDEMNFEMLNIPPYHPARDMWDTFWVNDQVVLRTHTSPGQIRCMRQSKGQPIRVILPGKCYRYEAITPRSEHQFFQMEGLVVGHSIRMTDLIGTIRDFIRKMYGESRKLRIRGSYFPFTEPSIEVDMDCMLCRGKGCRVCKHTGWLEVGGAGMVHPVVLQNGGYDPEEWSGFAFGMGVERPAMLHHRIEDIRFFYGNDLRFLRQF
ncbi:MAG: phenylalanine--tRNA ligase subunit alpha [Deltaproteobacteria bacterium]|nr:phenylalanine--tRNA ligase subunit alpha [Deltaproteobacteria bacterium]